MTHHYCAQVEELYAALQEDSEARRIYVVERANHLELYDGETYVAEAVSVLAPFFTAKLAA